MKAKTLLLFLFLICKFYLNAQDSVTLVSVVTALKDPIVVENCGDDRLFVALHSGQIFIINSHGKKQHPVYFDIRGRVHAEGLLGFTFDPHYKDNGYFYVYYVNKSTSHLQISRFKVSSSDPNFADSTSEKLILEIDSTYNSNRHNGGCIHFGPDGYLYIGVGDGNKKFTDPSQNPNILLGKMLRIDVSNGDPYSIPSSNPFVDSVNYRHEIWAFGMRNPWRWSFDAITGDLWIGDVGQHLWEEIDHQPANSNGGVNYGFPCYEGAHSYDTTNCRSLYSMPAFEYPHDAAEPCNSIIGGFVYRGQKNPSLYGKYIFADYCTGAINELYYENGDTIMKQIYRGEKQSYVSFGEDNNHELYVTAYKSRSVYQIVPNNSSASKSSTSVNDNLLKITPSISTGNFSVAYISEKAQEVTVRIQNLIGQQFYSTSRQLSIGSNTWHINQKLPKGNYYLVVTDTEHKTTSARFIVQ